MHQLGTPSWLTVHRVDIGGWAVLVEYDPEQEEFGRWLLEEKIIRIGPRAETCFPETLRHELRHAALDIGGVSYNERMENEAVVRCLDHIFDPAWEKLRFP